MCDVCALCVPVPLVQSTRNKCVQVLWSHRPNCRITFNYESHHSLSGYSSFSSLRLRDIKLNVLECTQHTLHNAYNAHTCCYRIIYSCPFFFSRLAPTWRIYLLEWRMLARQFSFVFIPNAHRTFLILKFFQSEIKAFKFHIWWAATSCTMRTNLNMFWYSSAWLFSIHVTFEDVYTLHHNRLHIICIKKQ